MASAAADGTIKAQNSDTEAQSYVHLLVNQVANLEKRFAELEVRLGNSTNVEKSDAAIAGVRQEVPEVAAMDTKHSNAEEDGWEVADPFSPNSRVRFVENYIDATGGHMDRELVARKIRPDDDMPKHAFVFRRVMSINKTLHHSEVDILSTGLIDILKANVRHVPKHTWELGLVKFVAPFAPLIYDWDPLIRISQCYWEDPGKAAAAVDLRLLLTAIESSCDELAPYFQMRGSNIKLRLVTFDTLWTIYEPGQLIYAKPFMNTGQIFTVESPHTVLSDISSATSADTVGLPSVESSERSSTWRSIICSGIDFDGTQLVKVLYEIRIPKFLGARVIDTLACFPLKYITHDHDYIMNKILERGKRFLFMIRSTKARMFSYAGPCLSDGSGIRFRASKESREVKYDRRRRSSPKIFQTNGSVIVDYRSYFDHGPGTAELGHLIPWTEPYELCQCERCYYRHHRNLSRSPNEQYENDDFLIFPPRVLGYSLHAKIWAQFSVENIYERPWATDALKHLVLDENYKKMILAFVMNYHSSRQQDVFEDIIPGKGQGLVMLFHGPPGCGKTLTAESIAHYVQRPLFAVDVADIGLDAVEAEQNLQQVFQLSANWNSILLFDEADVFLEARTESNGVNRNALVSVLLRVLEYYNGIIILTTNRISSFDPAAQSRIQLAIKYQPLDKDQKSKILNLFFGNMLHMEEDLEFGAIKQKVEVQVHQQKLNGRQIRNIVTSAFALARYERRKVTYEDFDAVIEATVRLQDHIDDINKKRREEATYKIHF